jgi:hypothetical protein
MMHDGVRYGAKWDMVQEGCHGSGGVESLLQQLCEEVMMCYSSFL